MCWTPALAQQGAAPDGVPASTTARTGGLLNDIYQGAFPVYAGQTTYTGTNVGAVNEPVDNPSASCQANDGGNSVYWAVRSTSAGEITIDLSDSDFDTIVTLLDGFDLSEVGCDDDGGPGTRSLLTATVSANFVYVIRVTGFNGQSGVIGMTVTGPGIITGPPNDVRAEEGFVLPIGGPGLYTDVNFGATLGSGEDAPSCQTNDGDNSIWRYFEAPGTGEVTFDFSNSTFDTILTIHDATDRFTTGAEIGCDDDGGTGTRSLLTVPVSADAGYFLRVSGFNGQEGTIVMDYTFVPATAAEATPNGTVSLTTAPNPARGETTVTLSVEQAQALAVEVFDVTGRRVATLHEGAVAAGSLELALDAASLPSGVYVVRAVGETVSLTERLTVVR